MGLAGAFIGNALSDNPVSAGDVVSNYAQNRMNQDFGANIKPTSTTINYNDDGSQSITHKAEMPAVPQGTTPAPVAATPAPAPVATPAVPTQVPTQAQAPAGPAVPTMTPAVAQAPVQTNPNRAPDGTWNDYSDQSQLPPESRMPQPNAAVPGQMPVQGQVQAPINPNAQPTQQPVGAPTTNAQPQVNQAPSTQAPTWQEALEKAQHDPQALWDFVQNKDYPVEARQFASSVYARKAQVHQEGQDAIKKFEDAFAKNDPKAQNQIMRDLRKDNAEGSIVKAYIFGRLGLHDLAKQEQQKLGAGQKISRTMLDGQSYSTDVDGNGFIQRAWDSQGKPVSDAVLSNLNSSGTAYGTHAYTSTSKVYTIPKGDANAGQEYRERFNSQTGKFENVISTGPNAGQLYNGNPGLEKSVQTTLAKKEGTEAISLNYAGALSATRGGANAIGKFNAENGTNLAIPTYGPNRGRLVDMNNGGTVVTPDSQGNFNPVSNTTTTPTGNVGEDLSEGLRSKISSGNRTYDEQKKLYDQSVANGTPGKLPNGLPVAKPGGTTHETNNALDIPPAKLTQEDRRELAQKGYYQPFPNDPVHWERITTPSRAGGTTPPAAEKVSPASSTRTPKEPVFREAGHEQESPATFKARQGAWAEANKKVVGQESQKMYGAESIYDVAKTIQDTLPKATGSLIGSKVDQLASVFGYGTEGAKATAQLQVLGNRILMNVPRFEGPQSDRDTAVYKDAAGRIADPSVPIETRMAAFKTIMEINQKYAPELDWSFGKHSDVRKRADQIIGGK